MLVQRIRSLHHDSAAQLGPVVYWMSRDQRVEDNWALYHAQQIALQYKQPLLVIFSLTPHFLGATWRQYAFMLKGLQALEKKLQVLHIPFQILLGEPTTTIPEFITKNHIRFLVSDFSPLQIYSHWKQALKKTISIPHDEVDTHNVIPCWVTSNKQEFSARTIRSKIHKLLVNYKHENAEIIRHPYQLPTRFKPIDWPEVISSLHINKDIPEITWCQPGTDAAVIQWQSFLATKLPYYASLRNDPNRDLQSNLSPYLHFGHIASERLVRDLKNLAIPNENSNALIEEVIVRKELADNFCFYNAHYQDYYGFPAWARKTLDEHRHDPRPYIYTLEQFRQAKTHDPLWNAAQTQMVITGKMHGYMRMYWAKKILEWSPTPEIALAIAIELNDTFEIDGRDPNGYTGIAWSIGGVHDRPWAERAIFGKIRYMNAQGCARKFDTQAYIHHWQIGY